MHLRYARRYQVHCPITLLGDHLVGEGTVRNVSTVRVLLPDQAVPMKVDLAVVRWSRGREFGLEFLRMQQEEQDRLRRFATALERESRH